MKTVMNRIMVLFMVLFLVLSMSACGPSPLNEKVNESGTDKEASAKVNQETDFKPFVVQNYNRQLVIDEVPEAVFAVQTTNIETLIALGLQEKIVGVAPGYDADFLPEYQEIYNSLNILGDNLVGGAGGYPSFEAVVNTKPDFIYGTSFSLGKTGTISPLENIDKMGIATYINKPTDMLNAQMDDVYNEILTLGRIFNVEGRASELVQNMSTKISGVQGKLGIIEEPVSVFVFDSEEEGMIFTAGTSLLSNLIKIAGGKNIFSDVNRNWLFANNEKIIGSKPEIIVIVDYGEAGAEGKITSFKNNPLFAKLPAVVNDQFVVVNLNDVLPGTRNADCVEKLAKGFYPEKFK
ncbi:ABC transporter substrate-binding protein [Desulfosporosinus youngiae]|uniref:ABC-type Fe3+-hydroxamate transport system, periplasmic component n=1 Tax=Desulfosporosinus youngiae DSM 17734 TaxID=768710 RepID=H5Y632_9FIRM|nr:ABC transporter substrate-binding protein [Desulfosporosinus youngiae]EHQ91042.1 ABC-type Fe3+-hydroxamate transport system, periplasmic component [Desulfosporosinus youngiae DSM 17734]